MYTKARVPLVCSYDSDADAAYVYLEHPIAPATATRGIPVDVDHGMCNVDLDAEGHVLGLEIIGARKVLPPALLRSILRHDRGQTDQDPPPAVR